MQPYREIFDKLPDGVTLHSAEDGAILDANEQFCEMLGYTREEILETSFDELHLDEPPYTADRAEAYIRRATTEGPQQFEWVDVRKDGTEVPVEVHLRTIDIADEQQVLGVVRDVRDSRRRAQELERERDRFVAVFESIPEPAIHCALVDGSPTIRRINRAFEEVFGYDRETAVGRPLDDLIVPPDGREGAEELNATFRHEDRIEAEVRRQTADGVTPFLLMAQAIRSMEDDGRPEGIAIYVDLTELKEREEELQWKNERLDKFAHLVSHDIRNPLNVALGRLELAATECDSEHLDAMRTALERIDCLIDDLLSLAKEGEAVGDRHPVELRAVVESAWATVETRDARLRLTSDGRIPADDGRLQQLFENLIRNAIEHGGDTVTITVGELPDGFYLEDDGPGFPEGAGEELLELGVTRTDNGTGLGLAIVQEIVEAHGWEITMVDGRDGGARVEITGVQGAD